MMNNEPYIKKKSRNISRFLCQEMMYDYVTEKLDEERSQAMKEFLQRSEEAQEDLEAFQEALNYCEQLSHLMPSDELVHKMQTNLSPLKKLLSVLSWNNWPQPLKWSLQGVFVSLLAAGVAIFIPWEKLQIDLDIKSKGSPLYVAKTDEVKLDKEESTVALQATNEITAVEPKTINEANKLAQENSDTKADVSTPELDSEIVESTSPLSDSISANNNEQTAIEPEVEEEVSRSAIVKSNLKGSLTRMYMTVKDFKEFSLVVEDFIRSVGGAKAGQVELGWEKNDTTRYFHFTIPEKDYPKLMELLRSKGDTRIMRTPHSRVMPEGKMRLILEISSDD